ncbi:FXYD domain-containing ion transport regulator 3-like isoform X2 [Tyto alba]|uniref:FXYD domain-containing ion transport regulator 3-like isoform X2 n=1 Tax=Tyto alba TaxID=56313 RepID=UPI001C670934|nr:FXYD domain-containing ion transport regulator 3-like isoform X2 [Tyto alba]
MVGGALRVLVLLAVLSPVRGNPVPTDVTSPFQYDWYNLRVAGLVVAAVLCVIGIIVLLTSVTSCVPCQVGSASAGAKPAVAVPLRRCPTSSGLAPDDVRSHR